MNIIKSLYQFFSITLILLKFNPKKNWGNKLISTKKGFYQLVDNKLKLIEYGEFYGLTLHQNFCYVFKRKGESESIILKYKLVQNKIKKNSRQILTANLDYGGHQMDFFLNHLYLTDTNHNRVLKINKSGDIVNSYYPIGKLKDGRQSDNYGHINSIFSDGDNIYLMCHNHSSKTGRNSEVIKLDLDFNVITEIKLDSQSAHNVVCFQGSLFHCNSIHSTLLKDNKVIFKAKNFTRGLSITEDHLFLGDSEYAKRNERNNSRGSLYLLEHDGTHIETVAIPGMVQEVRTLSQTDYALSSTYFHENDAK